MQKMHKMSKKPFKSVEYQEQVKELVYDNMEECEKLSKCMEALNWKWCDAAASNKIPNAMEIHNTIIDLFEHCENDIFEKSEERLMKFDGSYTAKTGGLVLRWLWNPKTLEFYEFEIMFDIWDYEF